MSPITQTATQYPNFFTGNAGLRRQSVISCITEHSGSFTTYDGLRTLVRSILTQCYGQSGAGLNKTQQAEVNRCLKRYGHVMGIEVQLPKARTKGKRPSAIPTTAAGQAQVELAASWWHDFQQCPVSKYTPEGWSTYLFCMISTMGYGYPVTLHIVSSLKQADLQRRHLSVPVHPLEDRGFQHERFWPADALPNLIKLYRANRRNRKPEKGNLADSAFAITGTVAKDREAFAVTTVEARKPLGIKDARQLNRALRQLAWQRDGLAPALFAQYTKLPLPVMAQGGLGFFHRDIDPSPEPKRATTTEVSAGTVHDAFDRLSQSSKPTTGDYERWISSDWQAESAKVIKAFTKALVADFPKKGLQKRHREDLKARVQSTADALRLPPFSAPVLALHWIEGLLVRNSIQPSTAQKYLSELLHKGFLLHDAAYRLDNWDEEDMEQLIALVTGSSVSASTLQDRVNCVQRFVTFCQRPPRNLLSGLSINHVEAAYHAVEYRNALPSLSDFERFLRNAQNLSDPNATAVCVACALGFYGGLRANEVVTLKLSNVFMPASELTLVIVDTKTPSGRRQIPLHSLAPEWVTQLCRTYFAGRFNLADHTGVALADVSGIGPRNQVMGFDRDDLIDVAIALLRQEFGPAIYFHTLRHAFATWLELRRRVARGQLDRNELRDGVNLLFKTKASERLLTLFDPASGASDYIVIRKLVGHSSFGVTAGTYWHS